MAQRKIQIIEYDDRTAPPEAIKAVERAATVDKCDWIGGVYATGFNLATAPTFAKHGYPQLTQACVTDQGPSIVKKYPGFFMFQSSTTAYAKGAINVLKKLKDAGQIGNKVAAVNVGDDFGIELANAGRPLFKASRVRARLRQVVSARHAGLHAGDQSRQRREPRRLSSPGPIRRIHSAFRRLRKVEALKVKAYYCAVGCGFQALRRRSPGSENILGAGGVVSSPEIRGFYKRHKEVTQVDADYWGSPFYYSMLEMLTQSIEAVGTTDRQAIADHFRNRKFKTLVGEVELPGQILDKVYTVGQWQGGFFTAVNGEGFGIHYTKVQLKTNWS